MSIKKPYPKSGDEQDAVYAKQKLKAFRKPKISKATKTKMNKRFRKELKNGGYEE